MAHYFHAQHPVPAMDRLEYFTQVACARTIWILELHPEDPGLRIGEVFFIMMDHVQGVIPAKLEAFHSADVSWAIYYLNAMHEDCPPYVAVPLNMFHVNTSRFTHLKSLRYLA